MINYVAINRSYDRINFEFDPNEKEIQLNFEKNKIWEILIKSKKNVVHIETFLYNGSDNTELVM